MFKKDANAKKICGGIEPLKGGLHKPYPQVGRKTFLAPDNANKMISRMQHLDYENKAD